MAEHSADKRLKHPTHSNTNELTCLNLAPQKPKIRGKINKLGIKGSGSCEAFEDAREKPKDYSTTRKNRKRREGGIRIYRIIQ